MAGSWSNTATNLIILIEQLSGYSGIFGYSPAPGTGTLILSVAAASGTDPYGNDYPAGLMVQDDDGHRIQLTRLGTLAVTNSQEFDNSALLAVLAPLSSFGFSTILQSAFNSVGAGDAPTAMILDPGSQSGTPHGQVQFQSPLNTTKVDMSLTGQITSYNNNAADTYTPVIGGTGGATWTTLDGQWLRLGPLIWFNVFAVAATAGAGAANITVSTPTSVDRTDQQTVEGHIGGSAAVNGTIAGIALTSGTGAVLDRVRTSVGANITGAQINAAGWNLNISGWYLEG